MQDIDIWPEKIVAPLWAIIAACVVVGVILGLFGRLVWQLAKLSKQTKQLRRQVTALKKKAKVLPPATRAPQPETPLSEMIDALPVKPTIERATEDKVRSLTATVKALEAGHQGCQLQTFPATL